MTNKESETVSLSRYLNTLVKGGMLPAKIAAELNRLPDEKLQAKALAQVRETLLPLTEQTVSDLLNSPKPAATAEDGENQKRHDEEGPIERLFALACTLLMLYGMWWVGSHSVKWVWHQFTDSDTEQTAPAAPAPPPPVPIPQFISGVYQTHHKVLLTWNSVGDGYTYRIYRVYKDGTPMGLLNSTRPWGMTSALVNAYDDTIGADKKAYFAVSAVAPDGQSESALSQTMSMELTSDNIADTVEPVP